jgi:hypothetical protein
VRSLAAHGMTLFGIAFIVLGILALSAGIARLVGRDK